MRELIDVDSSKFVDFHNRLTIGCSDCNIDKDSRQLITHCDRCAVTIIRKAQEAFPPKNRNDETFRRAVCGEEPFRSPSVDSSETERHLISEIKLNVDTDAIGEVDRKLFWREVVLAYIAQGKSAEFAMREAGLLTRAYGDIWRQIDI